MTIYRDFDGSWRLSGYETLPFSSERDARQAKELALSFASEACVQESRYRRASERGEKRREAEQA